MAMEKFGILHKELKGQKVSFICDSLQLEFSTGGIKNRLCFDCMDAGGAHWKLRWDYQSNFKGDRWVELKLPTIDVFVGEDVQRFVDRSSIVIGVCDGFATTLFGREYTDDDLIDECLEHCYE